jgi:hypothetical protein
MLSSRRQENSNKWRNRRDIRSRPNWKEMSSKELFKNRKEKGNQKLSFIQ